jgi:hypothetical protein
MGIENLIGQNVELVGIANNAKGGAVLITQNENVIYIKGLECWPLELMDNQIIVTGLLKREKLIPDPKITENGAISSGAIGLQYVLYNVDYLKNLKNHNF